MSGAGWVTRDVILEHPVLGIRREVHVMPVGDIVEHTECHGGALGCACGPDAFVKDGADPVIVHYAMDGRP